MIVGIFMNTIIIEQVSWVNADCPAADVPLQCAERVEPVASFPSASTLGLARDVRPAIHGPVLATNGTSCCLADLPQSGIAIWPHTNLGQ